MEVLAKYRQKNVIEKSFDNLKNYILMKRLSTHNTEMTCAKLFCAFLALIVSSEIEVKLGKFMKNKADGQGRLIQGDGKNLRDFERQGLEAHEPGHQDPADDNGRSRAE
ncbi:MAG: hypothetical protein LBV23_06465 [Deltaproteobacteria bacterium]|nr:hypothetical protein [Deltaproteobacteria bacterium]